MMTTTLIIWGIVWSLIMLGTLLAILDGIHGMRQ